MGHGTVFLGDLAVVLVVAAATGVLFRWLRQPVVLGYLLAGFIVGPYIPIPLFADAERVRALAEFGVVLVMFSVGLEFSFRRLARVLPAAGLPALVQMATLAWLGVLMGRVLGWGDLESVFLGACLAISSTMVVVRALAEVPVPRAASELALGILVAQDLVAILAIAGLTAVVAGSGAEVLAVEAGELALFLVGLVVTGLLVVPRLVRRLARFGNPEMMVVAMTGLCFGLALLAERMGYSVALGAFVAGSLVAGSGRRTEVERLVRPIRDLFAAVFFVAIGMGVDPGLVGRHWAAALGVVALVVVGQLVSVTLGGILAGRGLDTSVRTGAALGQIGEFSFIIATLGVSSGAVRPALYPIVVLAALATTFTTPLVLRLAGRIVVAIDRLLPARARTLLSLYPSWLDTLTARTRASLARSRLQRLAAALVLDIVVLVALVLLVAFAHRPLATSLSSGLGLAPGASLAIVVLGAVVLALPFATGLLRTGSALGRELAAVALPGARTGLDLAAAPRRAMIALLQIATVLVGALVVVAATQPFLPLVWGPLVLLLTGVGLALTFLRTSSALDEHVKAGALAFAEALLQTPETSPPATLDELLPGLGALTRFTVEEASAAAGRTLAAVNLRGRTGASVLAVRRRGEVHALPGGDWTLQPGDVLGLTGSQEAVTRAVEVLSAADGSSGC